MFMRRTLLVFLLLAFACSPGACGQSEAENQAKVQAEASAELAATVAPVPTAALRSTTRPDAGFYLYIGHPDLANFTAPYSAGVRKGFIDGAAIMVQWQELEPQPGVYDWSVLDRWVVPTVQMHKKVSVGVIAGLFAPRWLYGAGYDVPSHTFVFNRSQSEAHPAMMDDMIQPSFWHPVYLREYGKLMAQMSLHLQKLVVPGTAPGSAYRLLQMVKLSGINLTTEEIRVDASKGGGALGESDAAKIWASAGFTPQKVQTAFAAIAAATEQAFPGKILSMATIHKAAFPPVDDKGQIDADYPVPDPLTAALIRQTVAKYQRRCLIQWDALYQGPPPKEVLDAGKQGALVGWQLNGFAGTWGGSGRVYDHPFRVGPCQSPADFQAHPGQRHQHRWCLSGSTDAQRPRP